MGSFGSLFRYLVPICVGWSGLILLYKLYLYLYTCICGALFLVNTLWSVSVETRRSISLSATRWQESHCLSIVCRRNFSPPCARQPPKKEEKRKPSKYESRQIQIHEVAWSSGRCNYNNGWQITDTRGQKNTVRGGEIEYMHSPVCYAIKLFVTYQNSLLYHQLKVQLVDPHSSRRYLWSC